MAEWQTQGTYRLSASREILDAESLKFGETLNPSGYDNAEPSFQRNLIEGVETRRARPKVKTMVKA